MYESLFREDQISVEIHIHHLEEVPFARCCPQHLLHSQITMATYSMRGLSNKMCDWLKMISKASLLLGLIGDC